MSYGQAATLCWSTLSPIRVPLTPPDSRADRSSKIRSAASRNDATALRIVTGVVSRYPK